MNPPRVTTATLCIILCGYVLAAAQDMDKELSNLAESIAAPIKDHGKKKVTVLDFTDLQGGSSELGKYIAEQLTVNLVMGKREFSVLDRANLKSILAEHKLTATGLIDPENAKKLGMFAGVDTLILGTITTKEQKIGLTAKAITTDTAEIIGAAKAEFKLDTTAQQLLSHPATQTNEADAAGPPPKKEKPRLVKSFGDLRVELQPLQVVNGNQLQGTMVFTNLSPKKSIWVAISTDLAGNIKGRLTDSSGTEFRCDRTGVSGIEIGCYSQYGYVPNSFSPATELRPSDSLAAIVRFFSPFNRTPEEGACRIQIELLVGHQYNQAATGVNMNNFVGEIQTE